jgi:hypothetical protein
MDRSEEGVMEGDSAYLSRSAMVDARFLRSRKMALMAAAHSRRLIRASVERELRRT